jgi:hypothetical protein
MVPAQNIAHAGGKKLGLVRTILQVTGHTYFCTNSTVENKYSHRLFSLAAPRGWSNGDGNGMSKGKSNSDSDSNSRSLRDDNQENNSKGKSNGNSGAPSGMTTEKARATATATRQQPQILRLRSG